MNRHATAGWVLIALLTATVAWGKVQAQPTCVGDCDANNQVTIDEIVRMVRLVLDGGVAECSTADSNRDGSVTIDEVVATVTNALLGCERLLLSGPDLTRLYPGPRLVVGDSPVALVTDDFDGDAAIDLASANNASSDLSLLLQNDDGSFSPARRLPVANGPEALVSVRLDGDALPDLVGTSTSTGQVWVALSTNAFAPVAPFPVGEHPGSLAAGDFNGDFLTDVIVGNRTSADVSVLLSDGGGSFAPQRRFDAGVPVRSIAVAHLDEDLRLDVAAAGGARSVAVLFGDGNGALATPVTVDVSVQPAVVLAGDVNDDRSIDLIVLGEAASPGSNSSVAILFGDGEGAFTAPLLVDAGAAAASMALADVDDDTQPDIVTGNSGCVSVLYGRGNGTFDGPLSSVINGEASAVVVADFDADGTADVGYANRAADSLSILWGLGDRRLAAERVVEVDGMGPIQILSGDLDGDGTVDLASVNQLSDDVSILLNDGHGTLTDPIRVYADEGLLAATVGDLDGSTGLDLVTGNANVACHDCLLVFESAGDGTFEERRRLVTAARVLALAVADVDGNAVGDILSLSGTGVSAFAGMGTWSFADELRIEAGVEPRSFAVGDLDGDACADMAVANAGSRDVSVLLATGDGGFQQARSLALAFAPARIHIADLNTDGIADLFVRGGDRLSVLLGEGNGAFAPERRLIATASGGAFDLADVNSDGRLDFVTLAQGTAIYPGLPDLTFGAPQQFTGSPLAIDLKVLDINGDDAIDIVTANASLRGSISVIPGRPK